MRTIGRAYYSNRFWLYVIYGVGVPGFINYGPTGHGVEHGLFTPQSVAEILLSCICGVLFISLTFAGGKAVAARPIEFRFGTLLSLLLVLGLASAVSPKDNIVLSLYRMGEWTLAFALFTSIYSREPVQNAPRLAVDLVGTICWLSILIVWVVLFIHPSLAYESFEDVTGATQVRFGGSVIHPIRLGLMAATAFWYTAFFGSKKWKVVGCFFAFVTMLLTYSRIPWLGFVLGLVLYSFVRRSAVVRAFTCISAGIVTPLAYLYSDKLIRLLGRGMGASNLESLSDRTEIWAMATEAISRRPWIGYGYIDGVKNVLVTVQQTTWGTPPHCHNELLQMIACGGVLAGVLTVGIYCRLGWATIKQVRHSEEGLFFTLLLVQLFLFAIGGVILGGPILDVGALLVVCLVVAPELYLAARPFRRQPPNAPEIHDDVWEFV